MKNILNNIFSKEDENDVSVVFSNKKSYIPAESAYRLSRYGIDKTDKALLEEFFVDVRQLITQKNADHSFCGMIEVNEDLIKLIPQIKAKLTNELGYKVIILDDNCEIINNKTNTTEKLSTGSVFMVLIWTRDVVERSKLKAVADIAVTLEDDKE